MNIWLALIVLLSTVSGALVSAFTIMFFFFPTEPKNILGVTFQGIFPRRLAEAVAAVANVVMDRLDVKDELKKKFLNNAAFDALLPDIEGHVDDFLRHRLGKKMPMIGIFIGDNTIRQLKEIFMQELKEIFPLIMERYMDSVITSKQARDLLLEKFSSISFISLKKSVYPAVSKDLRTATVLSAFFGFVIGIAQALIVVFVY